MVGRSDGGFDAGVGVGWLIGLGGKEWVGLCRDGG